MSITRKSLMSISLGFGMLTAMNVDSAEARSRSGSRGRSSSIRRSGGISRSSSSRSIRSRVTRSSRTPIRTRISQPVTRNQNIRNIRPNINTKRIGSNVNKNVRTRITTGKISSKRSIFKSSHHNHNGHNHNGHNHNGHNHHKHSWHRHGHHHHHHWGGWFSRGHHGWGIGIYRRHRYYSFVIAPPVQSYCNPYCASPGFLPEDGPQFDYTKPMQQQNGQNGQTEKGMQLLTAASEAFQKGDLKTAITNADNAAREMPNFQEVHQFRSLVLFAMRQYGESAAAAHAALTGGQGWNWQTLRSFYPNAETYTLQLRALEKATTDNPKDAGSRFLLGYHYLMMGHGNAAVKELQSVTELEPLDQLASKLLKAVTGNQAPNNQPQQPAPSNSQPIQEAPKNETPIIETPKPVEPKKPVVSFNEFGTWKATRADGLVVELTLNKDGKFEWKAVTNGQARSFKGEFVLVEGKLKLIRDTDKIALEGVMTVLNENGFQFKLNARDENDPGLKFARK